MKYGMYITESFTKYVIIEARNSEEAEEKAENACNDGAIDVTVRPKEFTREIDGIEERPDYTGESDYSDNNEE